MGACENWMTEHGEITKHTAKKFLKDQTHVMRFQTKHEGDIQGMGSQVGEGKFVDRDPARGTPVGHAESSQVEFVSRDLARQLHYAGKIY